ncbi:DUF6209 family protein [Myxococcus sp. CA039A]|uniref:DUF6209 family protein n=1 Tax=Myxococcus sp. CA039A TaxID=2741737 RepID=UPI00157B953F|nr:DUF6209 family protein [Myxococcus sp. CA039A]NTX58300.1 hypothetical protein [Myxococcus sp. CA039A]
MSLLVVPLLLLGGGAAAQTPPVITFGANWSLAQSQTLLAGGQVQVAYDASRLPQCRATLPDGSPGWSLTGHYRLDGGAESSFDVAGQPTAGAPPVLSLPAAGTLELWFRVSSAGCEQYDSNYGSNFRFTVRPAGTAHVPTLVFQEGWVEYPVGTVKAGQTFVVEYDIDRLPECRLLYNGAPTWEVWVRYRFDNGVTGDLSVTQVSGYSRYGVPVTLTAPAGARSVALWFENWDRGYCRRWDSSYGQNYRFVVQP